MSENPLLDTIIGINAVSLANLDALSHRRS